MEDGPGKCAKGPHSEERKEPYDALNRTEPHRTELSDRWQKRQSPEKKCPHPKEPYEVLKGRQSLRTDWWKKTAAKTLKRSARERKEPY